MIGDAASHASESSSPGVSVSAGIRREPPLRAIVVPNIYDYNRSGMSSLPDVAIPDHWRILGGVTSEASLYWCSYEKMVVTSTPLTPDLAHYAERALGFGPTTLRLPRPVSGDVLDDLERDQDLLDELSRFGHGGLSPQLLVWGATPGSAALLSTLRGRGLALESEDIPPQKNLWTTAYLDSKVGCRELFGRTGATFPEVIMPEGYILPSLDGVSEVVRHFYSRGKGCLIKADRGANGVGLIRMESAWSKHPDASVARYIQDQAEEIGYLLAERPIVVEEIVPTQQSGHCGAAVSGSLFMNALIGPQGDVKIFGGGNELRSRQNSYIGAQMGKGSPIEAVYTTLERVMRSVCVVAAELGYQGHLGVDFLLDQTGRVFTLEANARRCSESPVYELGRQLFGARWSTCAAALVRMPQHVVLERTPSIAAIVAAFESVGSASRAEDGVAIPLCLGWVLLDSPALGYVVFGSDQEVVRDTETALMGEFGLLGISPR